MDAAMESAKVSAKEVQGKLRAKFDKVPVLQQAEINPRILFQTFPL